MIWSLSTGGPPESEWCAAESGDPACFILHGGILKRWRHRVNKKWKFFHDIVLKQYKMENFPLSLGQKHATVCYCLKDTVIKKND
jgi:hypothetical protein